MVSPPGGRPAAAAPDVRKSSGGKCGSGSLAWPPAEKGERELSLSEKPLVLLGCVRGGKGEKTRSTAQTVLWDETRRCFCFHWPRLLSGEWNRRYYFEALREMAPWQELLGPTGKVTRSTCWFVRGCCQCDYTYGGERVRAPPRTPLEGKICFRQVMEELTRRVFDHLLPGLPDEALPNSANLNLYADDSQTVGWHADNESLFMGKDDDCLIVSLSLGARREFWLGLREARDSMRPEHRTVLELDLEDGDLLTMEGLCQKHCTHMVPRRQLPSESDDHGCERSAAANTTAEKEGGEGGPARINVTWRWVRNHRRRCPLWPQSPTGRLSEAHLPVAASAGASTAVAQFWAPEASLTQWRRACEGCNCSWIGRRNCVRSRGNWLCRNCWRDQEDEGDGGDDVRHPSSRSEKASTRAAAAGGAVTLRHASLGRARDDFDGGAWGLEYLLLVKGAGLVQLPHPEASASDGWAWGAVLVGPGGWFPKEAFRPHDPTEFCRNHVVGPGEADASFSRGEAVSDFDGTFYGPQRCLTFSKGTKLAQLPHEDHSGQWAYGAVLVEPPGWFPRQLLGSWSNDAT